MEATTVALVRAALVTLVLAWSTSRVDVAIHAFGWCFLGSFIAGFTREVWMSRFPYMIDVAEDASSEIFEILPESDALVNLFSFAICGIAAFFLAGAEHKSKNGSVRGAWVFFAISRILFPISFCGIDYQQNAPEAMLVILFTILSAVGPLSSWPSRLFALSDLIYATVVQHHGQNGVCSGTEAAVVTTCLLMAHDMVHLRLLHFLESVAFAMTTVFIVQTTIIVALLRETAHDESWKDALGFWYSNDFEKYLMTKAPPALLCAWAVGMLLRTATQGRVTAVELLASICTGLAFGALVLYTSKEPMKLLYKPSFACTTAVVAMATASRIAAGRKRLLKQNKYILASGFFPRESLKAKPDSGRQEDMLVDRPSEDMDDEGADAASDYKSAANVFAGAPPMAREESTATAFSSPPEETARNSKAEDLYAAYEKLIQRIKGIEKGLFYNEALVKGRPSESEKQAAKDEVVRLKQEQVKCEDEMETIRKQLEDIEGTVKN